MSANCYVIHSNNELSSVSKDEVLIQSLAAYMKISFLHDFLFAKVWIRTDLIVVLLKTTSLFFFFYTFLNRESECYAGYSRKALPERGRPQPRERLPKERSTEGWMELNSGVVF